MGFSHLLITVFLSIIMIKVIMKLIKIITNRLHSFIMSLKKEKEQPSEQRQPGYLEYMNRIIYTPKSKRVVAISKKTSINQWVKFNGQYQKILTNDGIKERFVIPNTITA